MNFRQLSPLALIGKILLVFAIIYCIAFPLIPAFLSLNPTLYEPLGGVHLIYGTDYPILVLYLLSVIGVAIGIASLVMEDLSQAGKYAIIGGILAGNILNWLSLVLFIVGGLLCYLSTKPGEK